MADNVNVINAEDVIKQYEIKSLDLQSPTIGADIIERFNSINENFAKIIGSEYLKGAKGDSVVTKKIILSSIDSAATQEGYLYYKKLTEIIISKLDGNAQKEFWPDSGADTATIAKAEANRKLRFKHLDGAEFTLIYEVIEGVRNEEILTCLPFTYKDPLFGEITEDIEKTNNSGINIDLSCIICYDIIDYDEQGYAKRGFIRTSLAPTVHYDGQDKRFNWVINGVETGLAAAGPVGKQGKTGTGVLIAEYDESGEVTDNTAIYTITKFHFHVDNNTLVDIEPPTNDWWDISKGNIPPALQLNLTDNCMIFARAETSEKDSSTVAESPKSPIMSTDKWIWGLLSLDNSNGNTVYKIRKGGALSEILGVGTHTLLDLMELNRYNFIPYPPEGYEEPRKDGALTGAQEPGVGGVHDKSGHVLYASKWPSSRIYTADDSTESLNIGPSRLKENTKTVLNSEYDENYFNTVYIGVGENLSNYVRLNPNAKEGHAYIFPTTKDKPISGHIQYAKQLTEDAGTATRPIYFIGGVPFMCNETLDNNITGNAATSTSAEEAKKLTVSAGSDVEPVYFKDGVPVKCRAIDTQADKALNAGRLTKKVSGKVSENDSDAYDVGSETQAIYFKDGVPVSCGKSLAHDITGTAAKADALTKNAGDSTHPVYFSGGIPKQCSGSLAANITGNAATASKLITNPNARSGPNLVGATTNPVYFKDGLPVQCSGDLSVNITGTAAQSKKLTSNAGSSTVPVYFKDGVPVACQSISLNITGNAATASRADRLKIDTVGSSSEPVYFKNGVPVKCTISSTAAAAKRLVVENVGTASKPVYFKAGVPVACDSLSINTTGNAATATKLATARKIDITGGIAATEQNFDGSSNINIPVTSINENYLTWGSGKQQVAGPMDMAIANYLNANRLSFMPAKNIKVYYSDNGDSTMPLWKDYGLTDDQKVSLVTTDLGTTLYMGKKTNGKQTAGRDFLRVEITAENGNLYFSLKKIMLQISTNGAAGCYVIVEKKMNGSSTFSNIGKYAISGWSGWNAITCNSYMGGSSTSSINTMRLTFGFDSYTTNYNPSKNNVKFCIMKIAMHGENCWTNQNSQLAETGNIYSWNVNQSVSFPSNLEAPIISAEKMICDNIDGYKISANQVLAETNGSSIGSASMPWNEVHVKNIKSVDNAIIEDADIENATINTATIKNLVGVDLSKLLGHVHIQDSFPKIQVQSTKGNVEYQISNTPKWFTTNSDVATKKTYSHTVGKIKLLTSKLPEMESNIIDLTIPNLYVPIGLTYMNDYDDVTKVTVQSVAQGIGTVIGNIFRSKKNDKKVELKETTRYWADMYLKDIKLTITYTNNGKTQTITKTVSDYTLTNHKEYHDSKRNVAVVYPKIAGFNLNDIVLTKSGSKYKDLEITIKLDFSVSRTTGDNYKDATNTRVGHVYIPGIKTTTSTPSAYYSKFEATTSQPSTLLPGKINMTNNSKFSGTYIPKASSGCSIYFTKQGIRFLNGKSYFDIVPPKDSGSWSEDTGGYLEAGVFDAKNSKIWHLKRKFGDILGGTGSKSWETKI